MSEEITSIGIKFDPAGIEQGTAALEALKAQGPQVEAALKGVESAAAKTNTALAGDSGRGASVLDGITRTAPRAQAAMTGLSNATAATGRGLSQSASAAAGAASSYEAVQAAVRQLSSDEAAYIQRLVDEHKQLSENAAKMAAYQESTRGMGKSARELAEAIRERTEAFRDEQDEVERSSEAMRSFKNIAIGLFAGVTVEAFVSKLVSVQRELDVLRSGLITVTGSSEGAQRELEWLKVFAKDTPFGLAQATEGFVKMKALGLDPTRASLTSFGNTASAMSKDLNQMIEAVADASTGEFERLKEFGIKASVQGDQVALTFQNVTTSVQNNAADITRYLEEIGNNQFAGAMEERAKTLDGAIASLGDTWDEVFRTINANATGSIIYDTFALANGALEDAVTILMALRGASDQAGTSTGALIAFQNGLANVFETVAVLGVNVKFVLETVGRELGGLMAQAVTFAKGGALAGVAYEFATTGSSATINAMGAIRDAMISDAQAARKEVDATTARILNARKEAETYKGYATRNASASTDTRRLDRNDDTEEKRLRRVKEAEKGLLDVRMRAAGIQKGYIEDLGKWKAGLDSGAISQAAYIEGVSALATETYKSSAAGKASAESAKQRAGAHKTAETAAKKEERAYQSLVASIESKIAADRLELAGGSALTESQKIALKMQQDLKSGHLALTAAQLKEIQAGIELKGSLEAELAAKKALEKANVSATAAREKQFATFDATLEKLQSEITAQEEQTARLGLTKTAVAALDAAKLEMLATDIQLQAIKALDKNNDEATYNALMRQAQLYRTLASEKQKYAVAETAMDNRKAESELAEKAVADYTKFSDGIYQTLSDALMRGFESGKGAAENLAATVSNMFKTMVLRPTVGAFMAPVSSAASSAIGSLAGSAAGGLGNLLGLGSNVASLTGLTGGITTAITAGFKGASLAAGLAGPTTAGATGLMGMGSALAAIPGWGWALAGIAALGAAFSKPQTLHSGAGAIFSAAGGLQAGAGVYNKETFGFGASKEYNAAGQDLASGMAKGLAATFDGLAVAFGKKAGYEVALAFADDASKDGAWGSFRVSQAGKDVLNWDADRQNKWAPREYGDGEAGKQAWMANVASDARKLLADMELPSWASAILESLGDTADMDGLSRAVNEIAKVQSSLDALRGTLGAFANTSDKAFELMMSASGGVEALAQNAASYYENFYSANERNEKVIGALTAQLSSLGAALPASMEAYRALTEEQLNAGESGAELAAKLLQLNVAFEQTQEFAAAATAAMLQDAGIAAADIGKTFRDVLVGRKDAVEAGNAIAEMVKGGVYNALAGGFADQLTQLMTTQLITPVIQAAIAGASISEAVSQSAIDAMIAQATAAANALGMVLNDPAVRAAIDGMGKGIADALSAAGGTRITLPTEASQSYAATTSSYADAVAPLEDAWLEMLRNVTRQTQDASRDLLRLGMSSYESALAAIGDKAQGQIQALQSAGYMAGELSQRESMRNVRDTTIQARANWLSNGLPADHPQMAEYDQQIQWTSAEFDRLSEALAKLPPEIQAMVNAETALLDARSAIAARETLGRLSVELDRLDFTPLERELAGIADQADAYTESLRDVGQATAENLAAVEAWTQGMTAAANAAAAATADNTIAGLEKEIARLGFTDLEKEIASINDRADDYRAGLVALNQDTESNVGSIERWRLAMIAAASATGTAADAVDKSNEARQLVGGLRTEVATLGLDPLQKELATITGRADEYRASLLSLGQNTAENIAAVQAWESAMKGAAITTQQTASMAKAAQELQKTFASRNAAGALKDKLSAAMGGSGTAFAAQREAEMWKALGATTDFSKQLELATQLTDVVLSRQQVELQNANRMLDFGRDLRGYVDGLKIGGLSPMTNAEKLATAAGQYQTALAQAQSGDESAKGDLQGAASAYLELAQAYYAGNEAYAGIFGSITQSLDAMGVSEIAAAQQQISSGQAAVTELQRLFAITEKVYTGFDLQYGSEKEQLAAMQAALILQTDSVAQLRSLGEVMSSLPAEIAASLPVIDTSAAEARAAAATESLLAELRALRAEMTELRAESRQDAQMQATVTAAAAQANADQVVKATTDSSRAIEIRQGATLT